MSHNARWFFGSVAAMLVLVVLTVVELNAVGRRTDEELVHFGSTTLSPYSLAGECRIFELDEIRPLTNGQFQVYVKVSNWPEEFRRYRISAKNLVLATDYSVGVRVSGDQVYACLPRVSSLASLAQPYSGHLETLRQRARHSEDIAFHVAMVAVLGLAACVFLICAINYGVWLRGDWLESRRVERIRKRYAASKGL